MVRTDGICRGHGVIGEFEVLGDLAHERGGSLPIRQLFTEERVEHRAGGVAGLQVVLNLQRGEDVLRIADRQVGGVGVVRRAVLIGGDDVRELRLVVLGKAVGGGLCRRGLQVIQIAVLLLVVGQTLAHVVEHLAGKGLRLFAGQICLEPLGVQTHFVHADQADGGEVIAKGAQVALGVGIKAVVHQLGDDGALGLQAPGSDIHQAVKADVEVALILGQIRNARQVDGDHADGTGGFAGAEEAAGLLAKLAQVQTQAAAHAAHVGRLHVGVDVVGEVRGAVLGGHFKEQTVVFRFAPVEVAGDGIGGNRILETAAVGVAFDHDLDERLVDHVHLALAVAVGEIHLLAADDGRLVAQVARYGPVKGDVGKRRLRAPAGRGVYTVDKGLNALLDFPLAEVVHLDKRSEIRVKGGKRLSAGPLVLHDAQEIDHLAAERGQVLRRGRGDLARYAAQTFLNQLLEAPAGTVAGEHGQIVQVQRGAAVRLGNLLVVDLREPVVGGDRAGVAQNQTADRVGHGGVFLHAPVVDLKIIVHNVLVVDQRAADVAYLFALLAVKDVRLGDVCVACGRKDVLHAVLNVFHGNKAVLDLGLKVGADLERKHVDDARVIFAVLGVKCLDHGGADFGDFKLHNAAVTL